MTAILVLFGLPWLLTGSILAHEVMHAWLRTNGFRQLPPEVEEGLCQLMALLWLENLPSEAEVCATCGPVCRPMPMCPAVRHAKTVLLRSCFHCNGRLRHSLQRCRCIGAAGWIDCAFFDVRAMHLCNQGRLPWSIIAQLSNAAYMPALLACCIQSHCGT